MTGYNIIPLGQSGFISPDGQLDPHFRDQLDLYRNFEYKHMHFYTNVRLKNSRGMRTRAETLSPAEGPSTSTGEK